MAKNRTNKGAALISALFIMTLVAIAATAMSTRLQLDIYRTRISLNADKLYLASQCVAFWTLSELSHNVAFHQSKKNRDQVLSFPSRLENSYPGLTIKGSVYDLQARFNLNNLSDKKYQRLFIRLAIAAGIEAAQAKSITSATVKWLRPYQPGTEGSRWDYYLKQKSPYYPGQQLMQNVSELRLVQNVTAKYYQALLNYITVLPETTPINITTASKPVLMTLGNGLNEAQVNELLNARSEEDFDMDKLNILLKKLNIRNEQITTESQYFMSVATVYAEDLNLTTYTLIKRDKDRKGKITASIINESLNTP